MDKVFIEGLKAQAVIGIHEWERRVPQPIVFDVELGFDGRKAADSDAVSDTLDYAAICDRLLQLAAESRVQLVETLAERCCAALLEEFGAASVTLRLAKPAAVAQADCVGVVLQRHRPVGK